MKTDQEIREEAARLQQLAREWIVAGAPQGAEPSFVLPEPETGEATRLGRRLFRVEAVRENNLLEFLLVQQEAHSEQLGPQEEPLILTRSDSAYEVLREGYDMQEEERLTAGLTPILGRIEDQGWIEDADPEAIDEIEAIVDSDHLTPSARLRTRAGIVELLEGRLTASEFISTTIERQGRRVSERERLGELLHERISVT